MTDYSSIKTILLDKRREILERLKSIQESEQHEVEQGLNDGAQLWEVSEIRDGLDDQAARELNQVNDALARLDAGEYGFCESCARPIPEPRLKAMPFATLCLDCADPTKEVATE